jgi:hypothetical protein
MTNSTCYVIHICRRAVTAMRDPRLDHIQLGGIRSQGRRTFSTTGALEPLRARLAQNRLRAPLFDAQRFRRHPEAAYTEMWLRNESGLDPAAISVPDTGDSARRSSGPMNGA